ncbi:hypothetical protein [Streptomyces sp. NPDC001410]|uniref:hypothetical protein n=1 Tax=Streptomyces sp. NPDC001410 TaxID=3364574 RepID=UPI0036A207BE
MFELALRTGLRKGELLGLRWEDLDLNNAPLPSAAPSSAPAPVAWPLCQPRPSAPSGASRCRPPVSPRSTRTASGKYRSRSRLAPD